MTAKQFIEEKQAGVLLNDYTLTDMIWFMDNYAKLHAVEIIKKFSRTEAEYQANIKYGFPQYNIK